MKVPEKPLAYLDRTRSDLESQREPLEANPRVLHPIIRCERQRADVLLRHRTTFNLHDKMMLSLNEDGNIPDFAVIVEKGYGDPTPEVKAKMKNFYGFDHDRSRE